MKITELLMEGATDVLYHYTPLFAAAKILDDGEFKLARATGTIEQEYAPPNRPYFMSTTNSRAATYHQSPNPSSVMFVLDGQWFSQRYKVRPVDYWKMGTPTESEERVFSQKPTIPIGGVVAIHVLLHGVRETRNPIIRKMIVDAKRRGIRVFFYADKKQWILQNTRHSIPVKILPTVIPSVQRTPSTSTGVPSVSKIDGGLNLCSRNPKMN